MNAQTAGTTRRATAWLAANGQIGSRETGSHGRISHSQGYLQRSLTRDKGQAGKRVSGACWAARM